MKVFISHAQEDAKWADLIRRELCDSKDTIHFDVWNPELEIEAGENWASKTGDALKSSDAVVFLLSPQSVKSRWFRQEIDFALTNPRFRDRVVTVMVKPTKDVPWILRTLEFIDGTRDKKETVRDVAAALKKQTVKS